MRFLKGIYFYLSGITVEVGLGLFIIFIGFLINWLVYLIIHY